MEISIHSLLDGAKSATGTVVIIDVLRAFTTGAVALANGANRIIMVSSVEEALTLRDSGAGQICMGEVGGRIPSGFDFGNSPSEILSVSFIGKTIIQRTSAGTQGIVEAAKTAKNLFAGSLVTATATVNAIRALNSDLVTLVAMGYDERRRAAEDEICALHLRNCLEAGVSNVLAVQNLIRASSPIARHYGGANPTFPPRDLDIALDIDRYNFAISVQIENGRPIGVKGTNGAPLIRIPTRVVTFEDGDPAENPWVSGKPKPELIEIEPYSSEWPKLFEASKSLIAGALPEVAMYIEHVGSTAVPGLSAKPIIDIDLIVPDPDREEDYVPALSALGYVLTVRELTWYRHRMLRHAVPRVNLHVFGPDCPEHIRHILFRDWLCTHLEDRERYAEIKLQARIGVENVRDYNRNKQEVVRAIYKKIFEHNQWIA